MVQLCEAGICDISGELPIGGDTINVHTFSTGPNLFPLDAEPVRAFRAGAAHLGELSLCLQVPVDFSGTTDTLCTSEGVSELGK